MAPEVFRHEPYNNKADVYAFAMIAYELFEGHKPFGSIHPVEAARSAAVSGARPSWGTFNKCAALCCVRWQRVVLWPACPLLAGSWLPSISLVCCAQRRPRRGRSSVPGTLSASVCL
jgi:serine/threonine protein kinase